MYMQSVRVVYRRSYKAERCIMSQRAHGVAGMNVSHIDH